MLKKKRTTPKTAAAATKPAKAKPTKKPAVVKKPTAAKPTKKPVVVKKPTAAKPTKKPAVVKKPTAAKPTKKPVVVKKPTAAKPASTKPTSALFGIPATAPATGVIRQTAVVSASPLEVFDALVDGAKHAAFTRSPATSDARVGGAFSAWDGYISGKHLVLDPGKRIVQEWRATDFPMGHPASRLELALNRKGNDTQILMVHSGLPHAQAKSYERGWIEFYWKPLQTYFAKRKR